jgi:hypothetical protein
VRSNEGIENGGKAMEALKTMEEANRIIEDFTPGQFALYTFVYGIQIALCFWVALKLL